MTQNFYVVLGVTRDADLDQIRTAYRQLVRRFHPDVSPATREQFIEVRQAYETLSDPESRRLHDAALSPRVRTHRPADPLAPLRGPRAVPAGRRHGRRDPQGGRQRLFGAVDEFFDGWVPGFFNHGRQASRHKDLYVEMVLSPQEAATGGLYPLQVPVRRACRACGGTGGRGALSCPACRGGSVDHHELRVSMPPGVADGTRTRLSLEDVGLSNVFLNVLVSVGRR